MCVIMSLKRNVVIENAPDELVTKMISYENVEFFTLWKYRIHFPKAFKMFRKKCILCMKNLEGMYRSHTFLDVKWNYFLLLQVVNHCQIWIQTALKYRQKKWWAILFSKLTELIRIKNRCYVCTQSFIKLIRTLFFYRSNWTNFL